MPEADKSTSVGFDFNQIYQIDKKYSAGRIITKPINLGTFPIPKKYLLLKAKENMSRSLGIFALK